MSASSSAARRRRCLAPASPSGWGSATEAGLALKNKIVSADEAIAIIRDGDTVAVSGFVGIGTPDELILALARRFETTGSPTDLTLMFAAAPGDGKERGLNRLAHEGLVKRVVGGHWALVPKLARPRARRTDRGLQSAARRASRISSGTSPRAALATCPKVGLRTFVDPRLGGGKLNARTHEDLVELVELGGEAWLRYKAFPIHIALIRGTTADPAGNITMEREALTLDNLAIAMAAQNSRRASSSRRSSGSPPTDSLNPREVQIPGVLVDCVVLGAARQPPPDLRHGLQPRLLRPAAGAARSRSRRLPLDDRKVIARRCAFELPPGGVVNLGIGMPEGVAAVAAEERVLQYLTLTAEPGIIGGMPQGGLDFGAALNPAGRASTRTSNSTSTMAAASISPASAWRRPTRDGNVNVSRFGRKLAGAGGFINISQNAKKPGLRRHLHRRRAGGRDRGRRAPHPARRPLAKVPRRGRADHLLRPATPPSTRPARPLRHRALRLRSAPRPAWS